MSADVLVPPVVYTLWWIGVILALAVFVPMSVLLLHRAWRAARSIQLYAADARAAAGGIADNTKHIPALDATIGVAGEIVEAAAAVESKLDTVATVLARRAE